jgi:hypothetical protein
MHNFFMYRESIKDCRVKPALKKNYYCAAFLKQMPNFNLSLSVTSDINGVLVALFNPVFIPYICFITVNEHQKSAFFNTNCKYVQFWS